MRTGPGLREATYTVAGIPVRCAVVSGLGNARKLIERLKEGKVQYDFVEVMACPGGCVGGGGQPISAEDEELYGVRGERLYTLDAENPMRSLMKILRYRHCIMNIWANPWERQHTICCIRTIRHGICPCRNKRKENTKAVVLYCTAVFFMQKKC